MKIIFFTINDFSRDGGNTIRMYGIMNRLSELGHDIYLISNSENHSLFHNKIKHIHFGYQINAKRKRTIQILTGIFPVFILYYIYKNLFILINSIVDDYNLFKDRFISFEYLDNTLSYLFFKKKIIKEYTNDLHGIVPLEFSYKAKYSGNIIKKIKYLLKYFTSKRLDNKVFRNGSGFIYASNAMKEYYQTLYPNIQSKKSYVIPYVLDKLTLTKEIDNKFANEVKQKYSIHNETIIAFSGSFKILGGVPELIKVFAELEKIYPEIKLILVGGGETFQECKSIISSKGLNKKVILIGRAPYNKLQSFYSIADIIVCPDKQNPFSELIVHAKYYDALFSGKIVITGNFKSINEINKDQNFSLVYNPSSRESLKKTMIYSIKNKNILLEKYKKNKIYGIKNFTYDNYLDNFN